MFKKINNDNGIALMMVLVLLILVGGLTAALMSAGVFNIRFGGDEVERTQSLYAADAGVELIKSMFKNNDSSDIGNILDSYYDDEKKFLVYDNELNEYKLLEEEEWETISDNSSLKFMVKIEDDDNDKITFLSTGSNDNNSLSQIKISFNKSKFDESGTIINKEDGKDNTSDYIRFSGQDGKNFSSSDVSLVDLDEWAELLTTEFNILEFDDVNNEYVENFDTGKAHDFEKEEITKNNKQITRDIGGENIDDGEHVYFTGDEGYLDDDEIEFGDAFDVRGGQKIENSVVIIDGSMSILGNLEIVNSLVLVRGEVQFGGNTNLDESMLFVFNNGEVDEPLWVTGNGSVTYEKIKSIEQEPFKDIAWLERLFDDYSNYEFASDWRRVK